MMDIIANADLSELNEIYCDCCKSITDANLVALVISKRNLATVNIRFCDKVTFTAARKIIEFLKSDAAGNDRPHLKLNVNTFQIGDEEVIFIL